MAKLIKSVMLAAGAGIAVGLCATASNRRAPRRSQQTVPADDILRLEPLFDRLERIETSLESAEEHRERVEQPIRAGLGRRIEDAETELQTLRNRIGETERRATAAIEAVEAKLASIGQEIPALVETKVADRLGQLETRIGALEKTLSDQSSSIGALRDRAVETDANLQRLIAAIERLCERTTSEAQPTVLPFEAHLAEATQRESEPKKSRFSMTRIFALVAAIVLPFFSR